MTDTRWDPAQYLRFADHRLRPALELLQRVPFDAPRVVTDLGCGTGQVTRALAARWPSAAVTGVDHSEEMLERAREDEKTARDAAHSDRQVRSVRWIRADIADWAPDGDTPDLIFSNATLHWLPDHAALLPRLMDYLAPGGCLAVQMPRSWSAPSHRLMRQTLADGGTNGTPLGSSELRDSLAHPPVADPGDYYHMLAGKARALDIWETEYLQALSGEDAVLEWVKGTGLRPVLNGLAGGERHRFLETYRGRLRQAYPPRADGVTLYPFRRLFLVALR